MSSATMNMMFGRRAGVCAFEDVAATASAAPNFNKPRRVISPQTESLEHFNRAAGDAVGLTHPERAVDTLDESRAYA